MGEVIDLEQRRQAANAPDPDCMVTDSDGRRMYAFAVDWHHDGRDWTATIYAYDWPDAEARVEAMKKSLFVSYQLLAKGQL